MCDAIVCENGSHDDVAQLRSLTLLLSCRHRAIALYPGENERTAKTLFQRAQGSIHIHGSGVVRTALIDGGSRLRLLSFLVELSPSCT